jgi:hypothetical protein
VWYQFFSFGVHRKIPFLFMNIDVKFPGSGTERNGTERNGTEFGASTEQSGKERKRLADLWRFHEDLKSREIWKKRIMTQLSKTRTDEYWM